MIHQAVYSRLANYSALTALCPSIYPVMRPLDAGPPFVIITLDDDQRVRLLSGSQAGYRMARFSIDCYDTSLLDAINIADQVESALVDFRGTLGSTSPSITADHVRLERRGPHLFEQDTELHRVPLEFLIGYR